MNIIAALQLVLPWVGHGVDGDIVLVPEDVGEVNKKKLALNQH